MRLRPGPRLLVGVGLALLLLPSGARADRDQQARDLYQAGDKAYQANDYQKAYDDFKQAYVLSQHPALLYDVASALQGLGRPHAAAEALRTYLKQVPADPDRPAIEKRIASLDDAQRLLDLEKTPAVAAPALPPAALAPVVPAAALQAAVRQTEVREKRKRTIAIVATVVSVVLAGAAVGLAVGLAPHSTEPPTRSDLGPVTSTP